MKNPNSHNCPLCNYQMSPFDDECLRCHGKGIAAPPEPAPVVQAPPPAPPRTPHSINRAPSRPYYGEKAFPSWIVWSVLLLALFFGHRYYISTPQYSLSRARDTFIARDLGAFEKYVSIDLCTESLVNEVMDASLAESKAKASASNNQFEKFGQAFAEGLMVMLKPALAKFVKDTIRSVISKEPLTTQKPEDTKFVDTTKQKIEEQDLRYEGIYGIDVVADTAIVTLDFKSNRTGKHHFFKLQMRRVENYWQIIKWVNAMDFLKEIGADFNTKSQSETPGSPSLTPVPPSETMPTAPPIPVQ